MYIYIYIYRYYIVWGACFVPFHISCGSWQLWPGRIDHLCVLVRVLSIYAFISVSPDVLLMELLTHLVPPGGHPNQDCGSDDSLVGTVLLIRSRRQTFCQSGAVIP
jgi:hypothetical protein